MRVFGFLATVSLLLTLLNGCSGELYPSVDSVCAPVVDGTLSTDRRATVNLGGCTGTLIAPGVVLSAAHCGAGHKAWIDGVGTFNIVETVIHPDYVEGPWLNDLALHFLDFDVYTIDPAPLALPALGEAIVQGYGKTEDGTSGELREAVVTVDRFTTHHKILTAPGPDACYGDSGGPLYQNGALVGVVSSGVAGGDCGDGGLYTAPMAFVDWLTENGVSFDTLGEGC